MKESNDGASEASQASVLIVDDKVPNLLALEAVLGGVGAKLVRATSGAEALAQISEHDFAAILLDVIMPGQDGFQTARLVRREPRARLTPIIFMTAAENPGFLVEDAYALGAVDYITKPFVPAVLRAKVGFFVELYRNKQELKIAEQRAADLARTEHTERRRVTRSLEESEGQLKLITDSVPALISYVGRDLRYQLVNNTYEEWFGFSRSEMIGRSIREVLGEQLWEPLSHKAEEALAGHAISFETEIELNNAGSRWLLVNYLPDRDANGEVKGIVVLGTDITNQKRIEESLREQDRRKDQFIAMLAHELRNPLGPIRTAMQLLKRSPDESTVGRVREVVNRQVEHLSHIVDDLLDVSRVSQRKVELRHERLDLAEIVRAVARDDAAIFDNAGVRLTLDLPDEQVWVDGDRTRLTQVIDNLLSNSAKFTEQGGRVRAALRASGQEAILTVEDSGIGMSQALIDRIFEPFAQGDESLERTRGGLGLGLALVKQLLLLHGASVSARSEGPGLGSTFEIRMPTVGSGPQAIEADEIPSNETKSRKRVLIVEDNQDAALSLRILLELSGCEVRVAHTGPDGINAAKAMHPNLVLCDIGLPGMNGYEVAKKLREEEPSEELVLVAMTGYGEEEDRRLAAEAGFDSHLTKPVDPELIERLLANYGEAPR